LISVHFALQSAPAHWFKVNGAQKEEQTVIV